MGDDDTKGTKGFDPLMNKIVVLEPTVFDIYLSSEWKTKAHRVLSFADDDFDLEDGTGLLHKELSVTLVEKLDFSNNSLTNIDYISVEHGFLNLRMLKARRNQIPMAVLDLPTLAELNLSHNCLQLVPPLQLLRNLEILILSNNWITGDWSGVRNCPRLRRLDLASNQLKLKPSELQDGFEVLAQMGASLATLRLKDNPFVVTFPEYQAFLLSYLPRLTSLDDLSVTMEVREASKLYKFPDLSAFDEVFAHRQKDLDSKEMEAGRRFQLLGSQTMVPLDHLTERLNEATISPSDAFSVSKSVKDTCEFIRMVDPLMWAPLFADYKDIEIPAVIDKFTLRVIMVAERHETSRKMLMQALANLAPVYLYDLGNKCLICLSRFMQAGPAEAMEVLDCVKEFVIPSVESRAELDKCSSSILKSLSTLQVHTKEVHEDVRAELNNMLFPLIPHLSRWLNQLAPQPEILALLSVASGPKRSAVAAIECGLHIKTVEALENKQLLQKPSFRPMYLDLLRIVMNTSKGHTEVVEHYAEKSMHVRLIAQLNTYMSVTQEEMTSDDINTCGAIIDAISAMMSESQDILLESVESYQVIDPLLVGPTAHIADPILLKSSLSALMVVFTHPKIKADHMPSIVIKLQKLRPFLTYLGQSKYKAMYDVADKHTSALRGETEEAAIAREVVAPPLNGLTNHIMHEAFIAIVNIIHFFVAGASDPKNEVCVSVCEDLENSGREFALLGLLAVPNEDVKIAVLNCIEHVPLAQIDAEEVVFLVKILNDTKNIGAGRTEEIISKVIKTLQRIALDFNHPVGRVIREKHAGTLIDEVFEILHINAARFTYGNEDEENEKTLLSLTCVSFLRSISFLDELKENLRTADAEKALVSILHNEELLHRPSNPDIPIERCWTGRATTCLLQSLKQLMPRKKVAFRVISRIADILGGGSEFDDGPATPHSTKICANEAEMWDLAKLGRRHNALDERDWKDWIKQQRSFMALDGLNWILEYLTRELLHPEEKQRLKDMEEQDIETGKAFADQMDGEADRIEDLMKEREKAKAELGIEEVGPENVCADELEALQASEKDDEMPSAKGGIGRKILMRAAQSVPPPMPEEEGELFARALPEFDVEEELFADAHRHEDDATTRTGLVNPAFIVSAFFRCGVAMLTSPMLPSLRKEAATYFLKEHVIRQLLGITGICRFLDCNITAKFFRLMSVALTTADEGHDLSNMLILFSTLSNYVEKLCMPCLQMLKQTKDRPVSAQEQVLCAEMTQLMHVLTKQVVILRFSQQLEAQVNCVATCVRRFVTSKILNSVVHMVLYDLQSGSSTDLFSSTTSLRTTSERRAMLQACMALIALYIHWCPEMKYEVLELFSAGIVMNRQSLRPSFMHGLLQLLGRGEYQASVEGLLARSFHKNERTLLLVRVEVLVAGKEPVSRSLIASNYGIYIMDQPENTSGRCNVCPPERFCPAPPWVEAVRPYKDVCRIVRGFGNQKLTIGYVTKDGGEELQGIVCHCATDRDQLIEVVHALSACTPKAEISDRPPLEADLTIKHVMRESHVGADVPIFALTFALRVISCHKKRVSLFVLCDTEIMEFKVAFEYFMPSDDIKLTQQDHEDSDEDEIGPVIPEQEDYSKVEADSVLAEYLSLVKARGRVSRKKRFERTSTFKDVTDTLSKAQTTKQKFLHDRRDKARKTGRLQRCKDVGNFWMLGTHDEMHGVAASMCKENLLIPLARKSLAECKSVVFESGEAPAITLDLGAEKVSIEFFDDSAREEWRAALACALATNKDDPGDGGGLAKWGRDWLKKIDLTA